jgi:hypothetical protein
MKPLLNHTPILNATEAGRMPKDKGPMTQRISKPKSNVPSRHGSRFVGFCSLALLWTLVLCPWSFATAADKPNIIYVLCDDLGYGDVSCLNPSGKIKTPHMDRLAREGMIFTDAHSGSSVCTPTRYGVVTGRYAWRTKLQSGVLGGLSPRLIEQGRTTVADFLKQ